MIACLAVLALLAGDAAAQPGPPPAPNAAPVPAQNYIGGLELKAALCQIDVILAPMDGEPVPAAEASLCQPSFSIENASTYIAAGGKVLDFGSLDNALVAYYEFRSMAFGGAQQCAALSGLQSVAEKAAGRSLTSGSDWESNCRTHYNEMKFVQALVTRDPKAAALCEAWASSDPNPEGERHKSAAETCQRAAAASDLRAFGESACEGKSKCVNFFRAVAGDASACTPLAGEAVSHRALCRGYVAFAKAGPAKNPALCADNDVCLALSGSAVRATVDAQDEVAANLGPVLLPDAQKKLKVLVGAVDPANEAAAKELDSRAERIARLRMKYRPTENGTSHKHGPAKKGASNAQE